MTKTITLSALFLTIGLGLTACGGDTSSAPSVDRKAPNATTAVAKDAPYRLKITSAADDASASCLLSGTFTNNADAPLSGVYINYAPVFTDATLERLGKSAKYFDTNFIYGKASMTHRETDDAFIAPGQTISVSGHSDFGCEDVTSLTLKYFNCEGVDASGNRRGQRCGAPSLQVDNKTALTLNR